MKSYLVSTLLVVGAIALAFRPPSFHAVDSANAVGSSPSPIAEVEAPGRKFRMRLTLSSPEDLKVREGDSVQAGAILADRASDRLRLESQRKLLLLQLEQLKGQRIAEPASIRPVPPIAEVPKPLYLPQWAEIDRQRLQAEQAENAKLTQIRTVDALKSLKHLPPEVLDHESGKIAEKEREQTIAIAELKKAEAALERAKIEQAQAEYSHQLELSKRAIQLQQAQLERQAQLQKQQEAERDRSYKIAEIQTRLTQIENQISLLAAVRSPYHGKIQRVKFTEQTDRDLIVEIVLSIRDRLPPHRDDRPGADRHSSAETRSQQNLNAAPSPSGDREPTRHTSATGDPGSL
jgi:hypothetical protein